MNPYEGLESRAFWKTAVGSVDPRSICDLARPKHPLGRSDRVGTAGSCFAQHIARRLRGAGYRFVDVEQAPVLLKPEHRQAFGYEIYSARYGNIYTTAQLRQLLERALGRYLPEERVWETGGRFYDPFRPSIEPDGFASEREALLSQKAHLRAVMELFQNIDLFVFTLGLTEAWRSRSDGAVYPTCPGVQAGAFDASRYEFVNFTVQEVLDDLKAAIALMREINPQLRLLLTVSPVPLTATASGEHVLVATTYSKSVLRAVAGQLAAEDPDIDYFPSYELITAPVFGGAFFEKNRRSVREEGVDFVMETFFREFCQDGESAAQPAAAWRPDTEEDEVSQDDLICDEAALETYA